MNNTEEEKKVTEEVTLNLADPEDMGAILISTVIPMNLINDLNMAIENLRYLTTDVEMEDSSNFHCEPA